jgi:hypothetical protein
MGEYSNWKPQDDLGHSSAGDSDDEYKPGMGAMVSMGGDYKPGAGAMVSMGYEFAGYGPFVPPGYPRGSYDEPDMGFEFPFFGRSRARLHGAWKDRRGFWARLFNRPMAPVAAVTAPAPANGGAPPPPAVAPPAADMGWEWHDRPPAPIEGQWAGAQQWAGGIPEDPAWSQWQDRRGRGRRW